jgi:hypothetical protein
VQGGSSADGLELVGDDDRLVGFAGAAPLRLLAERTGLRAGLSAAMTRPGFHPVYDRGQLLIDLALTQILGGEAISDFQGLRHMAPLIGPVPSTPTVWRALAEVGQLQLTRVNAAVARFRRRWWGLLADRPEGFPWLSVAGRELTGITVLDWTPRWCSPRRRRRTPRPPTRVGSGSARTWPPVTTPMTCWPSIRVRVTRPRTARRTTSPCWTWRSPGCRAATGAGCWCAPDGAGFSHDLLEHIAAGGGVRGRDWQFSVGWSCTDTEMDAIAQLPRDAWEPGIDQDGDLVEDTFVADLTGLLDLDSWRQKIPGLRILVRDEPLHPRYRKRATDREKQLRRRYQLIAVNAKVGQIAWLDARHRSHVHVENDVKQAKDLGLNRWPSRHWAINVAWTQVVALAANLLACFRHLALPAGELRDAAPKLLRYRLWHLPARLTRGQRKRWLHLRADWPWTEEVINAWRRVKTLPALT